MLLSLTVGSPSTPIPFGRFGEDFTREQLDDFVRTHLAPRVDDDTDPGTLVVNVRRGDYFDAENRAGFAFDQDAYLKVAVQRAYEQAEPEKIRVVSGQRHRLVPGTVGLDERLLGPDLLVRRVFACR